MDQDIRWDDSKSEIMDIIDELESDNIPLVPLRCPICNTDSAHIYMYRWDSDKNIKGTIWAWCSNCKSCSHGSLKLPGWWENSEFVAVAELTSHPIFLEPKSRLVDDHLKELLEKRKIM